MKNTVRTRVLLPGMGIVLNETGPVVRTAPNILSFNDPSMIPTVYHRNSDKDDFWTHGFLGEHPPLLQILDHKEHSSKRKVIASAVGVN